MSRRWLLILLCACTEHGKGGGGGDDAPPIDAIVSSDSFLPSDAAACAFDELESNDTIQNAFVVPSQVPSFAAVPLCPATDKDTYQIAVTVASSSLEATTTVASGMPHAAIAILNAGGTTIVNGTSSGPDSNRALAANLPAGTYFVQVSGTASTTYRIDFDLQ